MDDKNLGVQQAGKMSRVHKRVLWGAIFLMATSSIGPAFLTQTSVFTDQFGASFAFAILISIIIDIGVQMNIWRVLVATGKRGQEIANEVFKGLGTLISILIVIGGIVFNVGNMGGAGLGLNVLFGISPTVGAIISGVLAVIVFSLKNFGKVMDIVAMLLGIIMMAMIGFVMLQTNPPVGEALHGSIFPESYMELVLPIITLIGGTVGGYITFAGGHRLLDAGIKGKENVGFASLAANLGILTTGVMRVLIFLAVLGVVAAGNVLDPDNPPASVFYIALGEVGYKIFGIVLFAAALTSIIGCAYTSVSFIRSFHKTFEKNNTKFVIGFIVISTLIYSIVGRPVLLLTIVGSLNGLILPLTLGSILLAARNPRIVGDYKHPTWLLIFGVIAVIITAVAGWLSLQEIANLWNG